MNSKTQLDTTEQQYINIISNFAVDLLSIHSVKEIVWHAANNVIAKLGFDDVVIYLFDDKKQKLIQAAAFGHKSPNEQEILAPIEISLGCGIVGNVALSKQALIVNDTSTHSDYRIDNEVRLSELTVPMVVDGVLIGVIDSEHKEKNYYNEHHLQCVATIASMVAAQISRLKMIAELENVVTKLEYSSKIQDSLFEIAELIFTTDSIEEFYRQLHISIGRLTFANNFYIALQSEDAKYCILPYCVDEKDVVEKDERISLEGTPPSISGYVLRENKPLLVYTDQIEQMMKAEQIYIKGSLPKSWLGVPFGDDTLKGIVVVQSYVDGFMFTEKDKQLLMFVAKHIHNAIQRVKMRAELEFLALHDPLTQLPNRLLFSDRVEQAITRVHRNKTSSLAILFLDLDHFKQVNDTYGHYIGDQLLITIAKKISTCLRESDTLCRLGGDEFAILLENITSKADVDKIANKIVTLAQEPIIVDNIHLKISTSIGITWFHQGSKSVNSLLVQADEAMYKAKLNGRNQIAYYES